MAQLDLFAKPKTMKQRVIEFARQRQIFDSRDLEDFKEEVRRTEGNVPGLLRIHREARGLCSGLNPALRRWTDNEKIRVGRDKRFAAYEYIGDRNKPHGFQTQNNLVLQPA